MNVLALDLHGSFIIQDVFYYMKQQADACKMVQYILDNKDEDEKFSRAMKKELSEGSFDMVFTTNYYPIVARICYLNNIIYCSWTYDSPPEIQSLETMDYPTNRIFFFSKYDYSKFKNDHGLENVYYLPLGVNTERLDKIKADEKYVSDVSLVGGLYKSDSYKALTEIMTLEQSQYLEAVVKVQLSHSGAGVVDASLTDEFISGVCKHYREQSELAVQPNKDQLFYSICSHITHIERLSLLRLCASRGYNTRLYASKVTDHNREMLSSCGVDIHGPVSYEIEMPQVFKSCKINLNPTLRANRTGMPLRIMDVLGAGGFLLTTHQAELDDFFFEDEIVTYETIEEAIEKIDYYLAHESERQLIARKGYERVKKDFSFEDRVKALLSVV